MKKKKIPNCYLGHPIFWMRKSLLDVTNAKKNFYLMNDKRFLSELVKTLGKDESIYVLSKKSNLSPFTLFIKRLYLLKFTKREISELLNRRTNYSKFEEDLELSLQTDSSFTFWGQNILKKTGELREKDVEGYLRYLGVSFKTENQLRGISAVTPDFLFEKKTDIGEHQLNWIEVKGYYGGPRQKRENTAQVQKYQDLFGPGAIVYWYGFSKEKDTILETKILDNTFFAIYPLESFDLP